MNDIIQLLAIDETSAVNSAGEDQLGEAIARPRMILMLMAVFGAMALVLSAAGIYGVLLFASILVFGVGRRVPALYP